MTLLELIGLIFTYNLLTFGNGPTMVPLIQKGLVDQRGVLTSDQLLYAFAIARVTPGQANLYVAAVGYFLFGIPGAVLTMLAIQLPGYFMLPIMGGYERFRSSRVVKNFTRGLTAASIGMIVYATISIGQRSLGSWIAWVVFLLTLAISYFYKCGPLFSLGVTSAVGVALKLIFGM